MCEVMYRIDTSGDLKSCNIYIYIYIYKFPNILLDIK